MAGELTPLVLLPRYSTFVGTSTGGAGKEYVTIAMDVTEFERAILNCWRGKLLGTSPTFGLTFQESSDQQTWSTCAGTNVSAYDPGEETEGQASATISKQWFRVKVVLGGTAPAATCWAVGFLERRLS
ncbi:MAG: hypothetical protein HUU06_00405 [Planctomycetaceae bacterium]|nr:hypothetical protein [Planctomycetota bacterium]NUN51236.1 hypothetical protein [Planctomycetaceae bacterium]